MLAWLCGSNCKRHEEQLRAKHRLVVPDDVAADLARVLGDRQVAAEVAKDRDDEYVGNRLLGVALLAPDMLYDPRDVMQPLSSAQRAFVDYWSPVWEEVLEGKVHFASVIHSARCISPRACCMHLKTWGRSATPASFLRKRAWRA